MEINPAKLLLKINGNPVIKEAIVLTLHIVIGIVAFAVIIPIILMVNSIHNFAIMTGRTNVLKKYSKIQWGLAVGVLLPSMLLILILGVVSEGARSHFYTTHGVVGLLLLLLTFAAFPLAYLRNQSSAVKTAFKINLGLIIQFIFIEILSGFNDLSTLTFCALQFLPDFIFILLGFILATPILQAVSLLLLELLFGRWRRNVPEKSFPDEKNSVYSLPAGSTGPTGSYMNI